MYTSLGEQYRRDMEGKETKLASHGHQNAFLGTQNEVLDFADLRDEVCRVIQGSILAALESKSYDAAQVNDQVDRVTETCLAGLREASPNFKYIVSCLIIEKNGSGMDCTSCCFWDPETDGSCTVRWENRTIQAIVVVFGLAL
jgi:dynein light chain Tctex-type 1